MQHLVEGDGEHQVGQRIPLIDPPLSNDGEWVRGVREVARVGGLDTKPRRYPCEHVWDQCCHRLCRTRSVKGVVSVGDVKRE
eukprot:7718851-Alexandrium_andersonii.AAC.1